MKNYENFFKCDLSNETELEETWKKIKNQFGRIHILINNAAIARGKSFKEMSMKEYK